MEKIMIPKHPELTISYSRIYEFFDAWALPYARNYLRKIIKTAFSEKSGKMPVASVFYFFEHLEHLTAATIFIGPHYDRSRSAILHKDTIIDLNRHEDYCGWSSKYQPWDYFPRFLTEKEYKNPYRVFCKMDKSTMDEWKKRYKDLLEYCYLRGSFNESVKHPQAINLYIDLSKLIEAAHLVQVRAISGFRYMEANKPEENKIKDTQSGAEAILDEGENEIA